MDSSVDILVEKLPLSVLSADILDVIAVILALNEELSATKFVPTMFPLAVIFPLALIWPLENMLHNELESVLTQEELGDLVLGLEEAKSSIRESSHSLKSLSQLLGVAPKTESEGVQQQFTFQYGTKKSKTLLS